MSEYSTYRVNVRVKDPEQVSWLAEAIADTAASLARAGELGVSALNSGLDAFRRGLVNGLVRLATPNRPEEDVCVKVEADGRVSVEATHAAGAEAARRCRDAIQNRYAAIAAVRVMKDLGYSVRVEESGDPANPRITIHSTVPTTGRRVTFEVGREAGAVLDFHGFTGGRCVEARERATEAMRHAGLELVRVERRPKEDPQGPGIRHGTEVGL